MLKIVTINYNSKSLTEALVMSVHKNVRSCPYEMIVVENSDDESQTMTRKDITVIDNTRLQFCDYDTEYRLQKEDCDTCDLLKGGSFRHTYCVQRLVDTIDDGFVLMDCDTLLKDDPFRETMTPGLRQTFACIGQTETPFGLSKKRVMPYLTWINCKKVKDAGVRYYDPGHMFGLHDKDSEENLWDTGSWFYSQLVSKGLPMMDTDIFRHIVHMGHGSWTKDRLGVDAFLHINRRLYWFADLD